MVKSSKVKAWDIPNLLIPIKVWLITYMMKRRKKTRVHQGSHGHQVQKMINQKIHLQNKSTPSSSKSEQSEKDSSSSDDDSSDDEDEDEKSDAAKFDAEYARKFLNDKIPVEKLWSGRRGQNNRKKIIKKLFQQRNNDYDEISKLIKKFEEEKDISEPDGK